MRIFLTGATGYVGGAIAQAGRAAGHTIVALSRNEDDTRQITSLGYQAVPGDLKDERSLAGYAREADAVIHAAITGGADAAVVDRRATEAMVAALEGSGRVLIYTSGIWVLGERKGDAADETAHANAPEIVSWRADLERWLLVAARRGVRTVIVRPGLVYGNDGGIPAALGRGDLPIVGDGAQLLPLVHREDVATLYIAALERAPAGSILHGVAHHMRAAELATVLAAGSGPRRLPLPQARQEYGALADALALHQEVESSHTQELVGWSPEHAQPGVEELKPC